MGIPDVMALSLSEFAVISMGWRRAHGHETVQAPSEDEFERAVLAARGVAP